LEDLQQADVSLSLGMLYGACPAMERLVLDTNIFVAAAFNPRSSSARILRGIEKDLFALVWNDATRRETETILRRIPRIDWNRFKHLFRPEWKSTAATHPETFAEVEDPDDRKFAALAAASGAVLVTNDRHLLDHRSTKRFEVAEPTELLRRRTGSADA
jgi:predicted nucleic acid-binding protein